MARIGIQKFIPDSGAVFAFGGKNYSGNQTTCFWLKADVVISVSCGDDYTAMLTEKGKVYVSGSNDWGQLGVGHTKIIEKLTCVQSLSDQFVTLIACGRNHTLAATKDDRLLGFGNNSDHQLGVSSDTNFQVPIDITGLPGGKIKKIAAGADFSVLLLERGDVYVWGSNSDGQLGLGNDVHETGTPTHLAVADKIVNIECGYYHTAMVSSSHKLYTFGETEFGKLGTRSSENNLLPCEVILPPTVNVDKIACGGSHTAFISMDQRLFTFGGGFHGELGHGEDIMQLDSPKPLEFFNDKKVCQIYCGENFSSVVTTEGMLYSFGDGRNGKLGLNSEEFSNQFLPVLCDKLIDYSVKFAACGGCHMSVFATKRELMATNQTANGSLSVSNTKSILPEELYTSTLHDSFTTDNQKLTLRNSLPREKRRKARDSHDTEIVPLNKWTVHDLSETMKSFQKSKSFGNDIENAPDQEHAPEERWDEESDISALNKVHTAIKVSNGTAIIPVAGPPSPESEDPSEGRADSVVETIPDLSSVNTPITKENMDKSNVELEKTVTDIANEQNEETNVQSTADHNNTQSSGDPPPETNKEDNDVTAKSPSVATKKNAKTKTSKFCTLL